jgi:hypothetical protein
MPMRTQLRCRTGPGNAALRRGITLIEVVVALTIFAMVTVGIAGFTTHVARGSRINGLASVRAGALAAQINRLEVLPYDTLPTRVGCTSISTGLVPRTECVAVQDIVAGRRQVTFILRPNNTALRPDTVIFERTRPRQYHPLNLF